MRLKIISKCECILEGLCDIQSDRAIWISWNFWIWIFEFTNSADVDRFKMAKIKSTANFRIFDPFSIKAMKEIFQFFRDFQICQNLQKKRIFVELFWNYEKLFTVASTIAVSANADWTQPTYRDAMAMSKQRGANWGFPGHGHKNSLWCKESRWCKSHWRKILTTFWPLTKLE